jgi:hypothetical protein
MSAPESEVRLSLFHPDLRQSHLIALLGVAFHSFEHVMIRVASCFMAAGFYNAPQFFHFFPHIGSHDGGVAEHLQVVSGQLKIALFEFQLG